MSLTQHEATVAHQIKALIRRRYSHVAHGRAGVPPAAKTPEQLGYPPDWLRTIAPGVVTAFRGCGFLLEDVDLSGVRAVADLGCGAGLDARFIADRIESGGTVFALDLTPEMLGLIRPSRTRKGVGILPVAADIEHLPLAKESIDLATANASFNLAVDKVRAAAETYRILRPGGRLVFSELIQQGDLPHPEIVLDPMAGSTSLGRLLSEAGWHDVLGRAGFGNTRVTRHRPFSILTAVRVEAQKTA